MRRIGSVLILACCAFAISGVARAGTLDVEVCGGWSHDAGPFVPTVSAGLTALASCGVSQPGLQAATPLAGFHVPYNASAGWATTAPAGISITGVYTTNDAGYGVGDGSGWWGEFYWDGGRSNQLTSAFSTSGCCQARFASQHLGWFFACALANGCSAFADLDVGQIFVSAVETRAPTITAAGNNLWYQSGWVRGLWPISFVATDPSGVCSTTADFGSLTLSGPGGSRNTDAWHQCPDQSWSVNVDTATARGSVGVGEGTMPLALLATNAAGVSTGLTYAKMVSVDNQMPTVAVSGPADAPSTAGVQYVTATGSAGPSDVSRIGCSSDGGPWQWYPGASTQVPVSGIGVHRVTCVSANNARDTSGNVATSAPATWTLSIREPTVSGIGFSKIVNALVCRRVRKRVLVPAHWVRVRRHRRLVRVRRRAGWRFVRVTRCHPQILRRRITVWSTVIRHGRKVRVKHRKTIRVVLLPRVVTHTTRRVGHGKRTTVSGWLGLADGTALGGQLVRVMSAPDNGLGHFRTAAVATTGPDGSWSAELPPGPSRLIEAVYDGSSSLEPSVSGQVRVLVPARVKLLSVWPRRVPWGGTVRIVGQLKGGYLPSGGALVRLRIGFGRSFTTYGVQEHVTGRGRFSTSYTFGLGDPAIHRTYWFQVASLPMGNYPYEPAASRRATVAVGGHPRNPPPRRHRRH